ncbi:MAG: hypothetical protein LKK01_02535 [Prevotella sp.]|nr:hypothetical protein [Prevotella sp.]MCI2101983.1 hypothetical protein [Prevotella sp.]
MTYKPSLPHGKRHLIEILDWMVQLGRYFCGTSRNPMRSHLLCSVVVTAGALAPW